MYHRVVRVDINSVWNELEEMIYPYLGKENIYLLPDLIKRVIKFTLGNDLDIYFKNTDYTERWLLEKMFSLNNLLMEVDSVCNFDVYNFVNNNLEILTSMLWHTSNETYSGINETFDRCFTSSHSCIHVDMEIDIYFLNIKFYCVNKKI